MQIFKAFYLVLILSLQSVGSDLQITPYKITGIFGSITMDCLTKPNPDNPEYLRISTKLFLTSHDIWRLRDTDWPNVTVTILQQGGESLSVLKVTDQINKKSVIIKCYNPNLVNLQERVINIQTVANSDFIRQICSTTDPHMPTVITASYLIAHSNQIIEVMNTASGYELWEVFFHKELKQLPFHPTDEEYNQILKKFGLSLAAFHLAGAQEEHHHRLSNSQDKISFFMTKILSDANLGNFIYNPETQGFSFIDTSMIALSLEQPEDFMRDLQMTYWHTFDNAREDLNMTRQEFNTIFIAIIDGYCSHPHFSESSSKAIKENMVDTLIFGPKPHFLQQLEAASKQSQPEYQL